jgi:chromosomal replication initiator protein
METGLTMHSQKLQQLYKTGEEAWGDALQSLHREFGDATFRSWFAHLTYQEFKDGVLIITAPSMFIREWIITNYIKAINKYALISNPLVKKVDLKVKPNRSKTKCITNDNSPADIEGEDLEVANCDIMSSKLDPKFTFENFVSHSSNKIAYAAAKAIAEGKKLPIDSNILYIHSPVGMGKTHLIQAIASYIRENYKRKKVAYLSAEKFTHLYVKSIRNNDLVSFKEILRGADVLLLDDLQFICGKNSTQKEFINIFNALTESNRKVVVTCDVSPYQLNLDTRSKSRLTGALVAEIGHADYEFRMKLLQEKSKQFSVAIPDDVFELIAKNISSSIRELEGALYKVITHASLVEEEITIPFVQIILKENLKAHEQDLTVDQIIEIVAGFYEVSIADILSKSRAAKFVTPRQVAAFLAKQLTTKSLQEIGHKLGGRDHATVIYSIKKLEERTATDRTVEADIVKLMEKLGKVC